MVATTLAAPLRSARKGLILMICGVALFSILNGVVKAQMELFPVNQVVFFRNFFSLVPLVILLRLQPGGIRFRTARLCVHLLLSVMFTATLFAIFKSYTLLSLADAIAQSGETVGMPWTSQGQKRYAGGVLLIGDIIVAYAHVARPWFSDREHHPDAEYRVAAHWRWQIHTLSMIVLLACLGTVCYLRSPRDVALGESASRASRAPDL